MPYVEKYVAYLGMDIHELRFELCSGIRLQNPEFCPQTIRPLLQACFYADPQERPNFRQIKENLQDSYQTLLRVQKINAKMTVKQPPLYMVPVNSENDNIMRTRYLTMKHENQKMRRSEGVRSNCEIGDESEINNQVDVYAALEQSNNKGSKYNVSNMNYSLVKDLILSDYGADVILDGRRNGYKTWPMTLNEQISQCGYNKESCNQPYLSLCEISQNQK